MTLRFFTRCHSESSVAPLTSGNGDRGERLTREELLNEFKKHRSISNREPTKLVSVSSRLVNTLSRALVKWRGKNERGYRVEKEPADSIFITFIQIPEPDSGHYYHHARALAEELGEQNTAMRYASEYVFERRIPPAYIQHTVSLKTLMDRGLDLKRYIGDDGRAPSTRELIQLMAEEYLDYSTLQYEIGLNLGFMARCFGAQAPLCDIAEQFIDDCTIGQPYVDMSAYYIYVRFGYIDSPRQCMGLDDPCLREDGIHTAICDWQFEKTYCSLKYQQHQEWVLTLEDCMEQDYIFFYECMCDGMYHNPDERICKLQEIKTRHEGLKADIESATNEILAEMKDLA